MKSPPPEILFATAIICAIAFLGSCSRSEKTPEDLVGKIVVENNIVAYTPCLPNSTLADGEELRLLVLVSGSGLTVDKVAGRAAGEGISHLGLTNTFVFEMDLKDIKHNNYSGRYYDVSARDYVFKHMKEIQLEIKSPEPGATVSAAIGVYDATTPNDNRFLRLETPVSTTVVK